MGWGEQLRPVEVDVTHLMAEHRAACVELHRLRSRVRELEQVSAVVLPPAPADRSDLVVMGHWVADCLGELNHLPWRTIVRRLADELHLLRTGEPRL